MSMKNQSGPETTELDQQVAEFADKVLAGSDDMTLPPSAGSEDLVKMQKAIMQLKSAARAAHPDSSTSDRIRRNVLAEWQKNPRQEPSPFQRFMAFWTLPRLAGGLAVIVVAGVLINLAPAISPDILAGAAGVNQNAPNAPPGAAPFVMAVIILSMIVLSVLIWFNRRR
jgi:hypothetical protein